MSLSQAQKAGERKGLISAKLCLEAIQEIDPKKHPRIREDYLRRGFGLTFGTLAPAPAPGRKPAKVDEKLEPN